MIETQFLDVEGLMRRWNLDSPSVVYGLRYHGDAPPAIRIGRELRFRLEDVEAWEQARLEGDHAA